MTVLPRRALPAFALLVTVLAACGGAKSDSNSSPAPVTRVPVEIGGVAVQSAGKNIQLTSAQKDAVSIALARYVTSAMATPLQTGTVGTDLTDVFDTGALADVNGASKDVMLDSGYPTGKVTVAPVTANLDAVADASGGVAVIDATMKVDAQVTTSKGPIHIVRTGTYVFTPDVNAWRIHGYDVSVTRQMPDGLSTTTSTHR